MGGAGRTHESVARAPGSARACWTIHARDSAAAGSNAARFARSHAAGTQHRHQHNNHAAPAPVLAAARQAAPAIPQEKAAGARGRGGDAGAVRRGPRREKATTAAATKGRALRSTKAAARAGLLSRGPARRGVWRAVFAEDGRLRFMSARAGPRVLLRAQPHAT